MWSPQVKLVRTINLPGSFLSRQAVYADNERIFVASYQGDVFVLLRDREQGFPLIQNFHLNAPLTAVTGDATYLYVSGVDGNLYVFSKTWPLQPVTSIPLSNDGLSSVSLMGTNLYVASGQASMAVSNDRLYLSELNHGDVGLDVTTMQTYGQQAFPGMTLVFNRQDMQLAGMISNPSGGQVNISTFGSFIYLTTPGCCGAGIIVYDANTMNFVQYIPRSTNTVAGVSRRGRSFLVGGSEAGAVDLYSFDGYIYSLISTADLPMLTGFNHPEDIEIRSLWVDGLDNLVIAASSWGNDQSRGPTLPSVFILEISDQTPRCAPVLPIRGRSLQGAILSRINCG